MRTSVIERKTAETDIMLILNLDGKGIFDITTGIGFMDHMLTLFAKHGGFDLKVKCSGDTNVDDHHSAEDIGICLGMAFKEALGDRKGIKRYADKTIPMDESLILSAVDISGRGYLGWNADIPTEKVGTFDTELVKEFWLAFVRSADITLHVRMLAGENSHHIIEGIFKSVARSMREAVETDPRFADEIPSSKGVL